MFILYYGKISDEFQLFYALLKDEITIHIGEPTARFVPVGTGLPVTFVKPYDVSITTLL